MTDAKLKLGILGISEATRSFLEGARSTGKFEFSAITDTDTKLAQTFSETLGCGSDADFRQFILKNRFDLLIISEKNNDELDIIRLALENGTNILKIAPFSRNLTEAADIYDIACRNQTFYMPADILRYSPGFHSLADYIVSSGKSTSDFYQIIIQSYGYTDTSSDENRWIRDPSSAGGGVLMHSAFDIIGLLVNHFGLPADVYSVSTNQASDNKLRMNLTEDCAIVTMKQSENMIVNICASRMANPDKQQIRLHGKTENIIAGLDFFEIRSPQTGEIIRQEEFPFDPKQATKRLLEDTYAGIKNASISRAASDTPLKTVAVIESAYISARTGTPEQPQKQLHLLGKTKIR